MNNNEVLRRSDDIDMLKGIGMLLVIFAHILIAGPVNWFIYIFHMPLFFFLSGVLYKPEKYDRCSKLIKSRAKSLLLPYLFYSVLTWLLWYMVSTGLHRSIQNAWTPLLQTLLAQGSDRFLEHNPPLWFVTCLFSVELIYYFVSKLKGAAWKLAVSLLISGIGYCMVEVFSFFPFHLLPWSLEVACAAFIFYAAGNLFGKQLLESVKRMTANSSLLCLAGTLAAAGIVFLCAQQTGHISFGSDALGEYPHLILVGGFAGILMMSFGGRGMLLLRDRLRLFERIDHYLLWIGKNSFRFMALHYPIKGVLLTILARMLHSSSEALSENWFYSIIVFLVTLAVATLLVICINTALNKLKARGKA